MAKVRIDGLKAKLKELAQLKHAIAVLYWDMEVFMPYKGVSARSESIASLTGMLHDKFLSAEVSKLLREAKKNLDAGLLDPDDEVIVRETWREYQIEKKLPKALVEEMAATNSSAHVAWVESRKKSDFSIFLPHLQKIVGLKKREADHKGYKLSRYDALLDTYEPGMTSLQVESVFADLKDFTVDMLQKIKRSSVRISQQPLVGNFDTVRQKQFNEFVAKKMGYDFSSGRLDPSVHPFSTSFHPQDVRITTRYSQKNIYHALGSTIHEVGHALYEQGLLHEDFGTPLSESISLAIHESQSRIWENNIGRSLEFWKYFYPRLVKLFPENFKTTSLESFHLSLNQVKPNLIRTESDEVSYNLHIILRFEIEKGLIEDKIDPKDLPVLWNNKVKDYLGLRVPKDALGVLQDTHWSGGNIGYFPTYALGNLYAAQFFVVLKKDLPDYNKNLVRGDLLPVRDWLRKNVHMHGKRHSAASLIKFVSGEDLNARYFEEYIREKYGRIYNL